MLLKDSIYLCALTSPRVLYMPPPCMCFECLLISEFASSHHWKRSLKSFLQISGSCCKSFYIEASLSLCSGSSINNYWMFIFGQDALAILLSLETHLLPIYSNGALGPGSNFINHWEGQLKGV